MNLEDKILDRINQVLKQGQLAELYMTVTNMFERIYGPHSPQLRLVETLQKQVYDGSESDFSKTLEFSGHLRGCLRTLASEIRDGLIVNIQSEARGAIFGDFLVSAREALDEEQKDFAAVLACAALEDVLKRCASDRGLEVQGKNMQTVVNALKSEGIINSSQGKVLDGYVQVRNDTFHARWDAIDVASVKGIIGYTQGFLAEQSASPVPVDSSADS